MHRETFSMSEDPEAEMARAPDVRELQPLDDAASFSLGNRLFRAVWTVSWAILARWTPPPFHGWRRFVLRLFGAQVGRNVRLYGSTRIWYPPNLTLGDHALLGPRVNCYNQGHIAIGASTVISQGAHLCASTHDISDPGFRLVLRPIVIGERVWVAADAFIGPGCKVGEGAVIGARAALFQQAQPWGVYSGNPATLLKQRRMK